MGGGNLLTKEIALTYWQHTYSMLTTYLISLSISKPSLTISYKLYGGGIKVSCPKSEKYAACFLRRQKRKENTVPGRHTSETIIIAWIFKLLLSLAWVEKKSQLCYILQFLKSNKMKENKSRFAKLLLLLIKGNDGHHLSKPWWKKNENGFLFEGGGRGAQ